ncbi:DNA-binding response regulator [Parabacteroides sp. 52]|uniref:response regulator transcription factor n=1 Tax=unclassified Parabacteroides TaxID=2649774 RepID=UPI0013D0DBA8|nr:MULTISPECIES: response regulator transcription factor [unclassified Parabacteroides]MDH6533793.1 DNA-binding response OmpR family regulator [Parabacteroides sp. PM5-20]NDV54543.1 DNA-binding response regulator [Parabacteroides sp. 52]
MEKQKILVVDDEANICEILFYTLTNDGYEVVCANSAEEAFEKLTSAYSLILLDVMMGGMSGYKMAETLRNNGNQIPIIFLTAKDTENDMLTGFSVGGDDYISKPFSLKEVSARVKALLKRQMAEAKPISRFIYKDFIIDFDTKDVFVGEKVIVLTRTEFEILEFLVKHQERIFSREEIIDHIWSKTPYVTERTVDVHITRLRKKLGDYASLISNRSGYGYRFNISHL